MTKTPEANPNALKHLFGGPLLKRMAEAIREVYPSFDRESFVALLPDFVALEMKPRVKLLRAELKARLPDAYPDALRVLLASMRTGRLKGFDLWPYSDFIQTYGLDELELSLNALKDLTRLFTSEFAVRPFLKLHTRHTLEFLERCAQDPDTDVRRWASEGTRPRLPWGERLQDFVRDPSPTLRILERLKFDPELYVRKSVSNHLNDIAKDHPEVVIARLEKWMKAAGTTHSAKVEWIIRRSLRNLIKSGHPEALRLIGVSGKALIALEDLKIGRKSYRMGDRIDFSFSIRSRAGKPQKLVVDYIIHYMKASRATARSPRR